MHMRYIIPFLIAALTLAACEFDTEPLPRSDVSGPAPSHVDVMRFLLQAPCTINVEGTGTVNIEDDYVPNVVACENGNAPMEALKAQAIQARGYLYYVMLVTGQNSIGDSQGSQVYSCTYTSAGPRHFEAARATRGQVLTWKGNITAPFYVAGGIPPNPDSGAPESACMGTGGADSHNTERWVTYNQGLSDCDISMTNLGWVPADCNSNPQNRGCASQNGQACLASRGWFYEEMQNYYYGEDIVITQATGTCGGASTAAPNYDAYCMNHNFDSYCFDSDQRVLCNGDVATTVEDCPGGCRDGLCQGTVVEETFCEAAGADGWHCADANTRIECEDDAMVATETCSAGCTEGQCEEVDDNGGDDNGGDDNGGDDNGGDDNGGDDNDDQTGPIETADSLGSLITTSPGIEGGCSQQRAPSSPSPAALLALLVMGLLVCRRVKPSRKACRRHLRDRE